MALQIITGPANAGKTGVAYARARSCAAAGGSAAVLLPAAPDVARVSPEFASSSPVGIRVTTVDGFIDALWVATGDGRELLTATMRGLLVAQTVKICHSTAPHAIWETPGTVTLLERLAMRAAEAGVEGVCLPDAGRPASATASEALLHGLHTYRSLLRQANLVERAEAHRAVSDSLDTTPLPDVIVINGVTGLTAAQESFVVAASRESEVVVCLTHDETVPATCGTRPLVERLAMHGTAFPAPETRAFTTEPELRCLERSLGGPPRGGAVIAAGAVRVSEAWGDEAEAARIVREVQDAIATGIEPGRIGIVLRDAAQYISPLGAALAEVPLAAEWDVRVPFGASGLGRVLQVVARLDSAAPTERMDVLRSPYSPGDAATLDILDARLRRSEDVSPGRFARLCHEADPEIGAFVMAVQRATAATEDDAVRRWSGVVAGMLGRAWPRAMHAAMPLMVDAGAARVFMTAVTGAVESGSGSLTDLQHMLRRARIAITSTDDPSRVQVMSAERARGRRFECVVVGGLNDGRFPRAVAEDPLRMSGIADTVPGLGVDTAARSDREMERLLFYQVATRASRRLVLSWQSHDSEGRPKRPSIFLEEVLDLYRCSDEIRAEAAGEQHVQRGPEPAVLGPDWFTGHSAGPLTERRALRSASIPGSSGRAVPAEGDGRIAGAQRRARRPACELSDTARRVLSDRTVFSVSEIEAYLQCPFAWFVAYVLRPRPLDSRFDAAAIGRVGHGVLHRFYTEYQRTTGRARVSPESLQEAQALYRHIAESSRAEVRTRRPSEELAVHTVIAGGARVIEADADLLPGFVPAHLEWSFGSAEGDEPESFGDFALIGRVDRIDVSETDLVVMDYKSGTLGPEWAHAAFERMGRVQLPLYAKTAARRLGRTVAGGLYRPIGAARPRGFIRADLPGQSLVRTDRVDGTDIEALIDDAIRRASCAVDGMRAGAIEPVANGSCPSYCSARAVCPREVPR